MRRDGALILRGDALRIPLRDHSVDLGITSPPYFALRSYRDGGDHYTGQIGSEGDPRDWLRAMWRVSDEMWRVLKPVGSWMVNIGEKYAGSGGHNKAGLKPRTGEFGTRAHSQPDGAYEQTLSARATFRNAPDRYEQGTDWALPKSLMGLPWAYALGMTCPEWYREPFDPAPPGGHPRWILRAEIVWSKLNGLPESVTDRVRRSHEVIFHFVKQGRYYSAVDELRTPHSEVSLKRAASHRSPAGKSYREGRLDNGMSPQTFDLADMVHPLGALPGSVWSIASEPLTIPPAVQAHYHLPDHFAAFPPWVVTAGDLHTVRGRATAGSGQGV